MTPSLSSCTTSSYFQPHLETALLPNPTNISSGKATHTRKISLYLVVSLIPIINMKTRFSMERRGYILRPLQDSPKMVVLFWSTLKTLLTKISIVEIYEEWEKFTGGRKIMKLRGRPEKLGLFKHLGEVVFIHYVKRSKKDWSQCWSLRHWRWWNWPVYISESNLVFLKMLWYF